MKYLTFIIILVYSFTVCFAQDKKPSNVGGQIETLQINSSPGYVIIGIEPENIQRPNSPAAFVAGVQSAIVNGKMQPNFAMETSPYYWSKKNTDSKTFDATDFLFGNNYGKNLLRSITFSFATSTSDSVVFGKLKPGTALGLGMHVQLIQGKPSPNTRKKLYDWYQNSYAESVLGQMAADIRANKEIENVTEWLDDILEVGSYKSLPESEKNLIKILLKEKLKKNAIDTSDLMKIFNLKSKFEEKSAGSLESVNKYKFPLTREGFMLELSLANARLDEESQWNNLVNAKTSVWLTPSYRFNINKDPDIIDFIDLMAVARLTFNNAIVDSSNYFDLGGKLRWIHNRLSLSGEMIYRRLTIKPEDVKKNYTFRSVINLSYKLSDMITFQAAFGSNFDGNSTTYSDPSKMFAIGGFNFGFGEWFKK